MMLDTVMLDVNQAVDQALTHHRAGRLGEAERLYRQVLAVDPRHADSLHLLGVVSHQAGRDDVALDLIGKAIALNDRVADYHCNIGSALCGLGRSEEGIAHYMRAIALDPRHALACNNLGNALVDHGKVAEGEARLRRALDLKPDYHEAHYNLGNALTAQDRLDEAVAHYRRAIALAPNFANAHNNLATTLEKQGRSQEAAAEFARVLKIEPRHASAHYNLGNLLRANAEYEAAIGHYKQALASRPDFADAWNNMGVALAERGDLEAAREAYRKSVEAEPARAAYHRNLAAHKRFEPGDPQFAVLEELAQNPQRVPEHERIDLQFALGKAYADLKQHERSFSHLLAGNALKRVQIAYDESAAMSYIGRIRATFGAELMRANAGAGDPSPTPVFIVGMPRSGTTLIEQIIASHPNAAGAGELFDLDNIARSVPGFPDTVSGMSGDELQQLGARYAAAIRAIAPAAGRVADKMPWNFHFCGLIHLALPNARIIHARRDAIDTCLSCFSILFDGNSNLYTYDLGELGRFYRAYESLMAHWRAVLPPGVMLEVQYEDVVADLESQARRIIAYCGLNWDDACLAFHKTRRPVRTSSVAQVRQPIYNSSVGRWRAYGDLLRPLLDALGIELRSVETRTAEINARVGAGLKPGPPDGFSAGFKPAPTKEIAPAEIAPKPPHHFVQFRPDSDVVHKHLSLPAGLESFWLKGNEYNNGGDLARLYILYHNLKALDERQVPGAMAELGVYKGNSAKILHVLSPARKLYLFDTFEGFDMRDVNAETQMLPVNDQAFKDTSLEAVKTFVGTDPNIIYCAGWFPDTASMVAQCERFALVHIDCDLGKPLKAALEFFYPRVSPGGLLVVHDYSSGWGKDVKPAVDKFMADKPETPILLPDKSGSVMIARSRMR
jgi:tetratricopeptide (TPR) repeat protein